MKFSWAALAAPLALSVSAGCGTTYHVPSAHVNAPNASIHAAEEIGAANHPVASRYLKLAKDERTRAQNLLQVGHVQAADLMYQRANADAELAVAIQQADMSTRADATAKNELRAIGNMQPTSPMPPSPQSPSMPPAQHQHP
jgi:hypothetical protein